MDLYRKIETIELIGRSVLIIMAIGAALISKLSDLNSNWIYSTGVVTGFVLLVIAWFISLMIVFFKKRKPINLKVKSSNSLELAMKELEKRNNNSERTQKVILFSSIAIILITCIVYESMYRSFHNRVEKAKCEKYTKDERYILIADFTPKINGKPSSLESFANSIARKVYEYGNGDLPDRLDTFYNPINSTNRIIDEIPEISIGCPFNGALVYGLIDENYTDCNMEFLLENDSIGLVIDDRQYNFSFPREMNFENIDSTEELEDLLICFLNSRIKLSEKKFVESYSLLDNCISEDIENNSIVFYSNLLKGLSLLPLGLIEEGKKHLKKSLNSDFKRGINEYESTINKIMKHPESVFDVKELTIEELKRLVDQYCNDGNEAFCVMYTKKQNANIYNLNIEVAKLEEIIVLKSRIDSLRSNSSNTAILDKINKKTIDSLTKLLDESMTNSLGSTILTENPIFINQDSLLALKQRLLASEKALKKLNEKKYDEHNTMLVKRLLDALKAVDELKERLDLYEKEIARDNKGNSIHLRNQEIWFNGEKHNYGSTLLSFSFNSDETNLEINELDSISEILPLVDLVSKYFPEVTIKIVGTSIQKKDTAKKRANSFRDYIIQNFGDNISYRKDDYIMKAKISQKERVVHVSIVTHRDKDLLKYENEGESKSKNKFIEKEKREKEKQEKIKMRKKNGK